MSTFRQSIILVFSERKNIILGLLASFFFGTVFVFGSGMIQFFPQGPFIELNPIRIGTLLALVLLSGLVVPMQWYALKQARNVKAGASGIGGIFAGMATMSCCAPLLLPALLSFLGFSGTQLLFLNMTVRQYVLPLSLFSIGLLALSLYMASRSVAPLCRIQTPKQL